MVDTKKLRALFEEVEEDPAYFIEVDTPGCGQCKGGRMWRIVCPGDISHSTTFEDEEQAQELADDLSSAYTDGVLWLRKDVEALCDEVDRLRGLLPAPTPPEAPASAGEGKP